ncbi:hypothetical protein PQG02_06870 [Nostoc sp. UHCC 0926]|uniref:hypothetical protein n=1 Tax=unclassified Nostoc TaxID=2593658 RepID=UPI00235E77A2|nr:hypothetical protein [Nostoc sp. UHCC 0926]WDD34063.1 hypothetical protein PQG02_06870 [Nostoc sp. UHCC 0926]
MHKFIQIEDRYVLNVETVNLVKKLDNGEVEVYQTADRVPLEVEGEDAETIWNYFSATSLNSCPPVEQPTTDN